jgi:hypothetical protein
MPYADGTGFYFETGRQKQNYFLPQTLMIWAMAGYATELQLVVYCSRIFTYDKSSGTGT